MDVHEYDEMNEATIKGWTEEETNNPYRIQYQDEQESYPVIIYASQEALSTFLRKLSANVTVPFTLSVRDIRED